MTINFKDWQKNLQEGLKGNQHKLDKNKNGKLDSQDFKMLRKEDLEQMTEEQIDEVLSKDASAGEWIHDFVHSKNPKFAGKSKEQRKKQALAAYYAKQRNEEVDLDEEVLDELSKATLGSYVKKATSDAADQARQSERRAAHAKDAEKRAKDPKLSFASSANKMLAKHDMDKSAEASKKSMKREIGVGKAVSRLTKEEGSCGKKTYREFVESLSEMDINKGGRYVHKGTYGTSYQGDDDDDEDEPKKKPAQTGEKRGRGRPKGSTSGARQKGTSSGKSYGGIPVHSLNLPNSNK